GVATAQAPDKANRQIEVRISPKAKVIRVGAPLDVRVEIWNAGNKQVFIEKEIYELCSYSPLSFALELGPPLKSQEGQACASDCLDDPKKSFASRLVQRWLPLPAGNFYGTTVRMDPETFPQLRTPGRWRLRGIYRSGGDLSSSLCLNNILL